MENNNLNTGHIVEVTPEIFEKAANDFSEGNEALKKLLTFCFENDIKTSACCSGHNGKKKPYIQFVLNDKNIKAIMKILKQISVEDAVSNLTFIKQPGVVSSFIVSMQKDKYNEGFEQILEALKYEKEVDINELDEIRQLMLKSAQNHIVPNSYLEFQEENDSVSVAIGEDYWSVFTPERETKQWTENTMINEYKKGSETIKHTLSRLESKTKNIRYMTSYPFDSEKVQNFWKDNDNIRTIVKNPAATIERQYEYAEKNVMIVNVLIGSSIETLANEIMQLHQYGQACITKFNSFVIDSRDYSNPNEIVEAYMKEYYRHRAEKKEQKGVEKNNEFIATMQGQVVSNDLEYMQNVAKNQLKHINSKEENLKEESRENIERLVADTGVVAFIEPNAGRTGVLLEIDSLEVALALNPWTVDYTYCDAIHVSVDFLKSNNLALFTRSADCMMLTLLSEQDVYLFHLSAESINNGILEHLKSIDTSKEYLAIEVPCISASEYYLYGEEYIANKTSNYLKFGYMDKTYFDDKGLHIDIRGIARAALKNGGIRRVIEDKRCTFKDTSLGSNRRQGVNRHDNVIIIK